ncbi:hypothetical protein SAMN05444360_11526 [Chryseobacterium carnipullorum]|nr:hypothetical protein SAMN05444360_11526 [Chryseobacterium carnipullorum]
MVFVVSCKRKNKSDCLFILNQIHHKNSPDKKIRAAEKIISKK